MKNIVITGLLLASATTMAAPSTPPSCDSPLVRLSREPIACVPSMTDIDFDIPSVELDIIDLKKIFEGAESSGGRIVGPMHVPRENLPVSPFPFNYNCELKVLLDGGKRVSYLSSQQVELNELKYFVRPSLIEWKHGLVLENSIGAPVVAEVNTPPIFGLSSLRVEVKYDTHLKRLFLNACSEGANLSCAQEKLTKEGGEVTLYSELISGKNQAKRTFKVSCHSH